MFKKIGKVGTSLAVLGAITVGSAAIAGAATGKKSSTPSPAPPSHGYGYGPPPPPPGMWPGGPRGAHGSPGHRPGTPLTGETAQKVRDAALAKVKGGTIERVEMDSDGGSPYEAHVRKPDGSEVVVLVDKQFEVTAVEAFGGPGWGTARASERAAGLTPGRDARGARPGKRPSPPAQWAVEESNLQPWD